MDLECLESKIRYYCKEKCFGKMQEVVKECIARNPNDAVYHMYDGFGLVLSGRHLEGIRELNTIQSHDDISLAVTICLMHAHKRCSTVDREAVQQLESRLKDLRRHSSALSFYYAGLFLFYSNRLEKATDFVNKSIKMDTTFHQCHILKGWIEIYKNTCNLSQKIADCFVSKDICIDATLGSATLKYFQRDFSGAIALLDLLILKHPSLEISLIEKLKNELALYNWDQVLEISDQILSLDTDNLQAMQYRILVTICKKGDYIEAADLLDKYLTTLQAKETKNAQIFYEITLLFSRTCGRSNAVLTQVYRFAKHAAELNPSNTEYLTELGHQCLMLGKVKDAVHFFKSASKVDDNSINALCGLTMCQMLENGPSEQIEQQVELLIELMGSTNKNPLLLLLSAKLESKFPDKAVSILNDAYDLHLSKSLTCPFGIEFLKLFNPDFLLEVNKEYLQYAPKKPSVVIDTIVFNFEEALPVPVVKSLSLLETVTKACPGLVHAVYLLAKLQFTFGKIIASQKNVQLIIENIDQTYPNAHLLLSQIHIQQSSFDRAEQSLEICLSYNFKVRDNPMYHLLSGIILKRQKKLKEALACFISATNLIGSKHTSALKPKQNADLELSLPDKATLYLELINVYTALGEYAEATKVMQSAIEEFSYTTEEARLTIVNAELALGKSDVDCAIELLSDIKPGQPYYIQAHTKLAYIYLKEKNDRNMFASCFKEVVANHPGSDGQVMLGDAYMSILEPTHAAEAYEKAIQQNPEDPGLAKKMGIALIKMHEYDKAIKFYKEIIVQQCNPDIKLDLADLFLRLKLYENAEEVLASELKDPIKSDVIDHISMKFQTKLLIMMATIKERRGLAGGGGRGALNTLKEARDNQTRLVKRAQLESHVDLEEEKRILSDICFSLAAQYTLHKSIEQAIQTYKEALHYTPQHPPVLLALAKLYMEVNEPDQCQQMCSILLSTNPENEAASVMMVDLAFRKVDFETASFHLKKLLKSQPAYWTALERLIDVQRRLGNLEEVVPFLAKAQESGFEQEPGYLYCAGLHARHSGDPNSALRHWGRARRAEGYWGRSAALGVVRVCLAPGGEALPPPVTDDASSDSPEDVEYRDTRSFALSMAERLLSELQPGTDATEKLELQLLRARLELASRRRPTAESTLRGLLQLAGEDGLSDDVGVAVTLATAYLVLKQNQRARNQLKRVSRIPWTPERAEWLESCWLLLADCLLGTGGGGNDAARDALERALKHNVSCAAAHEYCGYLAEKDQAYKQAASHYANAWKYGGQGNASVGYKYAHALLKAKDYTEAIIVSRKVMLVHPDCPKIRKDVFNKACNQL